MVVCNIIFAWRDGTYEIQWVRTYALPFFPREGDRLSVNASDSCEVGHSHFDAETDQAWVDFEGHHKLASESWESLFEEMAAKGWKPFNHRAIHMGPPGLLELFKKYEGA